MARPDVKYEKRPGALQASQGRPALRADADARTAAHSADAPAERLAYSTAEAALRTGPSCDLLYDQMRNGRLAFLKVGRGRIITVRNSRNSWQDLLHDADIPAR
jgi:hypothetical protein